MITYLMVTCAGHLQSFHNQPPSMTVEAIVIKSLFLQLPYRSILFKATDFHNKYTQWQLVIKYLKINSLKRVVIIRTN